MSDTDPTHSDLTDAVTRRPWLLALVTSAALFAFAITGVLFMHRSADDALELTMRDSLRSITALAARSVDPALHAQVRTARDAASPEYQQTAEPMEGLVRSLPILRSMYTFRVGTDGGVDIVVDPTDTATGAIPGMRFGHRDPALLEAVRSGSITISDTIYNDARGSTLSAYSPVRNAAGGIECFVGVDMDANELIRQEERIHIAVGLSIAFALIGSSALGWSMYGWHERTAHAERARNFERAQLLQSEALAQSTNQAKDDFIANVSHEIRTPLAAIIGYAELLREQRIDTGNPLADDAPNAIARNGAHLLGVVNDILDVSQVEAGALAIHAKHMDLRATAREAAELLAIRADAKGITLTVECEPDSAVAVLADPMRVRQILLNLIGNAIKFTDSGNVRVAITREGPWAVAAVHDSGPGMTAEQISRLFQRFSRVDRDTSSLGTGIGLELSQRLARLMHGGIAVESTPGSGTTFRLSMMSAASDPLSEFLQSHPSADGQGSMGSTDDIAPLPLAGIDVLIAEDGVDNARLWRHHLEQAGAEVWQASNGREAIGLVRAADMGVLERPFDIVLMDMEMPIMDGVEATQQLRSEGFRMPIVGLTAHSDVATRTKLLDAGCNDCATKPISRVSLTRLILAHVRGGQQPVMVQESVSGT
ncbi:MAG: response regulator [Planctomycetes bacterium]|nr:response regulator [Planctomycetota bacterium]